MQIREARKLIGKRVLGHGVVGTLEEIHPGRGRSWCVLRAEELREWSTKYAMGDRVTVGIMNLRAWPHPPQGWLASVEQAWVRAYDHARRDVEGGPGARPNWMFEEARERLALLTRARPTSLPPSEPRPRTTPKPVLIFTPEGPVHVYRFEPPTQQPASAASAYIRFARTRCGLSEETHHVAHSRFDRGVPLDAPSPEELPWCQTCRAAAIAEDQPVLDAFQAGEEARALTLLAEAHALTRETVSTRFRDETIWRCKAGCRPHVHTDTENAPTEDTVLAQHVAALLRSLREPA